MPRTTRLDALIVGQSSPAAGAVPGMPPTPNPLGALTQVILICAVVFLSILVLRKSLPDVGPRPSPSEHRAVLFLEDKAERSSLSKEQQGVLSSMLIPEWCRDNKVQFRCMDYEEDLSKIEPIWTDLKSKADPHPSMTIAGPRGIESQYLPEDVGRAIAILKETFE